MNQFSFSFRITVGIIFLLMGQLVSAQEHISHGRFDYASPGTAYQLGIAGVLSHKVMPDGFTNGVLRHSALSRGTDFIKSVAGAPDTSWTGFYGRDFRDECYSVQQTTDSGYISVGRTCIDGAYDYQAWLIKTNQDGDTVWSKTYGDTYVDEAYKVRQTSDAGYIIAGMSTAFGWAGEGWLIRTDNKGTVIWNKGYHPEEGSSMAGWDYIYDVVETEDGGFVFAGHSPDTYMNTQAWIGKVNSNGDLLWNHKYGLEYWERIFSLEATSDGGFIGVGDRHWTHDSLYYKHDGWLLKFNSAGDTTWTQKFGGNEHDIFRSVKQTSDGGYFICGERELSTSSGFVGWIVKTDSLGNEEWNNSLSKGGLYGVHQDSENNFVAAGTIVTQQSACEGWLLKVDGKGDLIWEKIYHGTDMDDVFLSLNPTDDGGYILGGKYNMMGDGGDYWLVKLKAEEVEGLSYFFENFDTITPPALPEDWSALVKVILPNTVAEIRTIEQGSTTSLPNDVFIMNGLNGSNGQPDTTAFVALITPYAFVGPNGATLTFTATGTVPVQVGTITDPADKNTFTMIQEIPLVSDFTEYTVTFNEPGNTYLAIKHANTFQVSPVFVDDVLFQQITTTGTGQKEFPTLHIYPNPANEYVVIDSPEQISSIEIFNFSGNKVYSTGSYCKYKVSIATNQLAPAYYLVKVMTNNGIQMTEKILIVR
jgi:hypothetical protein